MISSMGAWVLGVALQLQQGRLHAFGVYVGLCGAAILFLLLWCWGWMRSKGRWTTGWRFWVWRAGWLLCWGLMGFGLTGWHACWRAQDRLAPALEGVGLDVVGVISALPQRNEWGWRFRFEVESAQDLNGQAVALPRQLLLNWSGGSATSVVDDELDAAPVLDGDKWEPRVGERWRWRVRLKAPHGLFNPHGFDYELWLWEQGIGATGAVGQRIQDPKPRRLSSVDSFTGALQWRMERARQVVRAAIFQRLQGQGFEAATAGIVAALVMGDQRAIEAGDWALFRATGVAHLMSISGLHITLFAYLAGWCVGLFWRWSSHWSVRWWPARWPSLCLLCPAPRAALWGGVLLATVYAWFSGWGIPAQRTVGMLLVVAVLKWRGRQWPWPLVCLLCLVCILLWDPWAFLQAGFWLSFVAVAVLLANDARGRVLLNFVEATKSSESKHRTGWRNKGLGVVRQLWREQAVLSLCLLPLCGFWFQQISVVALLANLLAIPWVTWVLTPLGFGGLIWSPLWDAAAWGAQVLTQVLQPLSAWPGAYWHLVAPSWIWAVSVFAGALCAVLPVWPWLRVLGLFIGLSIFGLRAPAVAAGEFEMLALDVGQGVAILVRTASHHLLYDTGPRYGLHQDAGQRVVVPVVQAMGWRVDHLVLSHKDSDHSGGALSVLREYPNLDLWSSFEFGAAWNRTRPEASTAGAGVSSAARQACVKGQSWTWDGVRFEFLHPAASDYEGAARKSNAMSCVLRISTARRSALLTGDIEAPQEAALVQAQSRGELNLQADVLLVPHHGSKTSSTEAFLQAIGPQQAWIQAGYRNRFGHPAPPVRQRLSRVVRELHTSAECGAMHWQSSDSLTQCERDSRRRYWHHVLDDAAPAVDALDSSPLRR